MRVLFLGPEESKTLAFLRDSEAGVHQTAAPVDVDSLLRRTPDVLVSHGFRHIVPSGVLDCVQGQAVNLHISYLPWNRGSDPNVWSIVDGTPKGVTVHYMDPGLDSGDIIAQRAVEPNPDDTLRTSWERLQDQVTDLFREHWPAIRAGTAPGRPQPVGGSVHRARDLAQIQHLLADGWDTRVSDLVDRGRL